MKRLLLAVLVVVQSALAFAEVFYWRAQDAATAPYNAPGATGNFYKWYDFGDPANWSRVPSAWDNPDGKVPGSEDLVYAIGYPRTSAGTSWTMGNFDLGGGEYQIAGFSKGDYAGNPWKEFVCGITNGTLSIAESTWINAISRHFQVYDGGCLEFPAGEGSTTVSAAGLYEDWTVKSGGEIVLEHAITPIALRVTVEPGGAFVWNPATFDISRSIAEGKPTTVENRGTFTADAGILWNGGDRSGGKTKTFIVTQRAGTMSLGGDFTKTTAEYNLAGEMRFVFEGGTLKATDDVAFKNSISTWGDEVSAAMPDDASGTAEVASGKTLDMRIFSYGANTSLQKTGAGTLVVSTRPATLSVSAGTVRFATAQADSSGLSFAPGTTCTFGAPGNAFGPLSATGVSFALEASAFAVGSVVLESEDAALLAAVAESIVPTLPTGTRTRIRDGVLSLASSEGVMFDPGRAADLSDPEAWGGEVPVGEPIVISGDGTVARIGALTPAFASISVTGGATLEVVGSGVTLPPVTLAYPARLRFAGETENTLTVLPSFVGSAAGLPVFEIATNAVVTVPYGTGFKNVDVRLYGEIGVPGDVSSAADGLTFGTADAGETAWFAMTAIGGHIRMGGTSSTPPRRFCVPADGTGAVVVLGEILLKDVVFPPLPDTNVYFGFDIGYNNTKGGEFTIVLDNTVLPLAQTTRVFAKAQIRCVNGGGLRSVSSHPGVTTILQIRQYTKVTLDGPESGIYFPYSDRGSLATDSYVSGGATTIELVNGGWIATHRSDSGTAATNAVFSVSNGTWRIATLPFVPYDKNPYPPDGDPRNWLKRPFAAFKSVAVATGGTLFLQSSSDLGGSEWDRDVVLENAPITGGGDVVVTNGVPGYGLAVTVECGHNTATGCISVAPSPDVTRLKFADGANWAGTVVADGRVALTNLTEEAPSTVSFRTVRFSGMLPIRVWRTDSGFISDQVNLSEPPTGTGGFEPVLQDGTRFRSGDVIMLGTWAESAVPSDHEAFLAKNWRLETGPSAAEGCVTVFARCQRPGMLMIVQ